MLKGILLILLLPSLCFASDKGYNCGVNKSTKEIVGCTYGDGEYHGMIAEGYTIVTGVPISIIKSVDDDLVYINESLKWDDKNDDNKVQSDEIVKKDEAVIRTIKNNNKKRYLKKQIIKLSVEKDKADSLGYTNISTDIQVMINDKESQVTVLEVDAL